MRMFYRQGLFFVDTDNYDNFAFMHKIGFAWYPKIKLHCTPFFNVAQKLMDKCKYGQDVVDAIQKCHELVKMSNDPGLCCAPYGDLYPFQISGLAYIKDRAESINAVLIADDMGLGKTIEACAYVNTRPDIKEVIIICPASLKDNWRNEWREWNVTGVNPTIINYERLINQPAIISKLWDLAIVDELHYIKNPQAKRTKAITGARGEKSLQAKIKIGITGTPILNRPIELFPALKWLLPTGFTNRMVFARRYCGLAHNGFGWDMKGASNLDELQLKLRSTIMLRRKKEDVLTQLPPKRRQIIEIEPTSEMKRLLEMEEAAVMGFGNLKSEILSDSEFTRIVKKLTIGTGPSFENLSRYRSLLGELKIPMVIEHLEDCLAEGIKVVCFAHHQKVIDALYKKFPLQSVVLTGQTAVSKRQGIVDSFQNDKNKKLFIGNIKAAGVGITLTASSHVVFAEEDWVPGNITQAEDRTNRIGQTNGVLVQHLVVSGSLDAMMCRTIVHKQEVIEKALDKKWDFMEGC